MLKWRPPWAKTRAPAADASPAAPVFLGLEGDAFCVLSIDTRRASNPAAPRHRVCAAASSPSAFLDCAAFVSAYLDKDSRASLRAACRALNAALRASVAAVDVKVAGDVTEDARLMGLASRFPGLTSLTVNVSDVADPSRLEQLLSHWAGSLPYLVRLEIAGRLHAASWRPAAALVALAPRLQALLLPHCAPRSSHEQRCLAGALAALPALRALDLGSEARSAAPLRPELLAAVGALTNLATLAWVDASGVEGARAGRVLGRLTRLEHLAARVGDGAGFADAMASVTKLTHLELESARLGDDAGGWLARLPALRSLALGLCEALTPEVLPQVRTLRGLTSLAVPFPLGAPELATLSKLPALQDLLTLRRLHLSGAPAEAPPPVCGVTKLVAGGVQLPAGTPDRALADALPALRSLCLKHLGCRTARAVALCERLEVLVACDARHLDDGGLAALRALKRLHTLSLTAAPNVTDAGCRALFSHPLPALLSLSLTWLPRLSDQALLHVCASARRLTSVTLDACGGVGDAGLARLARLEALAELSVRRCSVGGAGVAAMLRSGSLRTLSLAGCAGLPAARLPAGCQVRRGLIVRVDGRRVGG